VLEIVAVANFVVYKAAPLPNKLTVSITVPSAVSTSFSSYLITALLPLNSAHSLKNSDLKDFQQRKMRRLN
jgi:hypothetical protein